MSKAQELIKKEGLGGMIITDPYNMRHISGFQRRRGVHCTYLPPSRS